MAKATAPDTTALSVSEAAAAIGVLINASPRSPRTDEIEAVIARVGAEPDGKDEEPIAGPVDIKFEREDFAEYWLTVFQLALDVLAKDDAGLREAVNRMVRVAPAGEIERDGLDRFLGDLETCAEKLGAMAHFADVAKSRLALAALRMAGKSNARWGELTEAVLQMGGRGRE